MVARAREPEKIENNKTCGVVSSPVNLFTNQQAQKRRRSLPTPTLCWELRLFRADENAETRARRGGYSQLLSTPDPAAGSAWRLLYYFSCSHPFTNKPQWGPRRPPHNRREVDSVYSVVGAFGCCPQVNLLHQKGFMTFGWCVISLTVNENPKTCPPPPLSVHYIRAWARACTHKHAPIS